MNKTEQFTDSAFDSNIRWQRAEKISGHGSLRTTARVRRNDEIAMLEGDAFELALGDEANQGHDETPEPRHVNNFAALAICRIGEVGGAGG
jgi:hypothetical protein